MIEQEGDGPWRLLHFIWQENSWQQMDEACSLTGSEAEISRAQLADLAALELAKRGWQDVPLLYVIPEDDLLGYVFNLPPHLNAEQQTEAAFWELDDRLADKGLSATDFACICMPLAELAEGTRCVIWGVRREYLQEIKNDFASVELTIADVIAGGTAAGEKTGGAGQGVAAYLADPQRQQGFCHHPARSLAAGRLVSGCLLLLFFPLLLWLAFDVYDYEQAQNAACMQREELNRLRPEKQEMEEAVAQRRCVEEREQLWRSLQDTSTSWYSLLVHLGMDTCEGVFLTGFTVTDDGRCLRLNGQAVTYDALAEFIGCIEKDPDIFPHGVRLEDSALRKGTDEKRERIDFSLVANEGQENDGADDNRETKSL
ncbi:PilN domain-containing protein [Selenomonas ruminantium]|uniref:PilN domain-containing protein n=1 Tax=Selenomonas ruminantium TaxID=971 RepID=UPI0011611B8A|nr:PilN domain-containing protein [Selenomonas ruminantium]